MSKKQKSDEGATVTGGGLSSADKRRSSRLTKVESVKRKKEEYREEFVAAQDSSSSSEEEDSDLAQFLTLSSPSGGGKAVGGKGGGKAGPSPQTTVVQSRFSVASLCEEENIRRELRHDDDKVLLADSLEDNDDGIGYNRKANSDDQDDDDDDDDDDDGSGNGPDDNVRLNLKEFLSHGDGNGVDRIVEEPCLSLFFHLWDARKSQEMPGRIRTFPQSLLTALNGYTSAVESEDFIKQLLGGNWIPTFFDSCPDDVARWLYSYICYSKSDELSAAAWDVWMRFFGRPGMWDPQDVHYSWFKNAPNNVSIDWVPSWSDIVDTLGHFGAPASVYRNGIVTSDPVRDDPPEGEALLLGQKLPTFPSNLLRRFLSVTGLSFYASALGRLPGGQRPYTQDHAIILVQIALAILVDPLMASSLKREILQCAVAALAIFPDDIPLRGRMCDFIAKSAPRGDTSSLVTAVCNFAVTTERPYYLRRCLALKLCYLLLQKHTTAHSLSPQDDAVHFMSNNSRLCEGVCLYLEVVSRECTTGRITGKAFVWFLQLLQCLDLVLADRNAILALSIEQRNTVKSIFQGVRASWSKKDNSNDFAMASKAALIQILLRFNEFSKDEAKQESLLRMASAADRIGFTRTKK